MRDDVVEIEGAVFFAPRVEAPVERDLIRAGGRRVGQAVDENRAVVARPRVVGRQMKYVDGEQRPRRFRFRAARGVANHRAHFVDLRGVGDGQADRLEARDLRDHLGVNRRDDLELAGPGVAVVRPREVTREMLRPLGGHPVSRKQTAMLRWNHQKSLAISSTDTLTGGQTGCRFSIVQIPRVIHDHAAELPHSDHTKPKIDVRRLVIERQWYRSILAIGRTPRIDDESFGDVEHRPIHLAVIGEQVIALCGQINQLFELVWDREVPHRQAQDNSVRALEAIDQFQNAVPCARFCIGHWLAA